jgi:hypothetical protein
MERMVAALVSSMHSMINLPVCSATPEEQGNSAQQEIYTALMEIDGVSVLLHFDEVRRLWFDPRRPEVTYPEQAHPEDKGAQFASHQETP